MCKTPLLLTLASPACTITSGARASIPAGRTKACIKHYFPLQRSIVAKRRTMHCFVSQQQRQQQLVDFTVLLIMFVRKKLQKNRVPVSIFPVAVYGYVRVCV